MLSLLFGLDVCCSTKMKCKITLSELIAQAQELIKKYGDLGVVNDDFCSIGLIAVHEFDEDESDWNIKAGDKVAQINSCT